MDRTNFQNELDPKIERFELGRARLGNSAEPMSISDLLDLGLQRAARLWTALKFQFHQKTFGAFHRRIVRQWTLVAVSGCLLFKLEPSFINKMSRPVVSVFSASDFELDGASSLALRSPDRPAASKAKKTSLETVAISGNPYAPVDKNQLQEAEAMSYVERFAPIARAEMEKFGIPASIALAQGLVESRAGTSRLARQNNNHFGMKCFSKRCRTGHCTNATDDHHKDFFRKYQSAWESWREHSKLLASGHYAKLRRYGRDYRQWAYGLKACGYATDRTYAEKLIGMIERYDLHRFDR